MIRYKKSPRIRNAKKTVIEVNGKPHTFPSHAEALYYLELVRMQKAGGIVKEIELQPKFILRPAYRKCSDCKVVYKATYEYPGSKKGLCPRCGKKMPLTPAWTYRADFRVTYTDGHQDIIDVKGYETEMFREKKRQFEYIFPELSLKVVKVLK